MNILIVEDDAVNALCVMDELQLAGHTVSGPVTNIDAALREARLSRLDLALVDIDLERTGQGVELAETLQREGVPSIFVTAQTAIARGHAESALGLLAKPFYPADVSEAVEVAERLLSGAEIKSDDMPMALELFQSRLCGMAAQQAEVPAQVI